jgi:hypothetical protein
MSAGIQCATVVLVDVAERLSHLRAVEFLPAISHDITFLAQLASNLPSISVLSSVFSMIKDQGTTLGRLKCRRYAADSFRGWRRHSPTAVQEDLILGFESGGPH